MNKKEAVAYAQITLDFMQSSKYKGKITPETFGVEMRQCFKLYPKNLVLGIAESKLFAEKAFNSVKNGCDTID